MADNSPAALDAAVLDALAGYNSTATYVIRNALDWPGKPWHRTGLKTARVLASCRRLQKRGHVEGCPTSYMVMKSRRITDAGRATLAKGVNHG